MSYSKGPWRSGDMFNTVFGPKTDNPSPEVIATVSKGNRYNARLIACAPEMLEMLYTLLPYIESAASDASYKTGHIECLTQTVFALINKADPK